MVEERQPVDIARSEIAYEVKFGGRTQAWADEQGRFRVRWIPQTEVRVAYDTPIAGYRVDTCNTLRLWKGEGSSRCHSNILDTWRGDNKRAGNNNIHSQD